jgi:glucose/arabinose dehydrogenase
MFIVEQTGAIRVLADGALLATPLLDLSAQITTTGNEQGLLGLAFPPNYAETGHFFVNYTDRAGDTLIARYQVLPGNPNQADPNSAVPVLTLTQPARNHNGGMLLFGPDGYLWVGTGDGGGGNDSFGNGQNPRTLLGKMLRLDVTTDPSQPYLIPSDNPWVATDWNGVDVRDEIWAVGLRNPWRYSFDRLTGDLWIGDVGQNRYEEINLVLDNSPGRLNFGWPQMEGQHCTGGSECAQAQFELPVFEYQHSSGCSVTGGYVYRGSQFPALVGVYFFGDYCSGRLWGGWQDEQGQWAMAELLQTDAAISSFGEDEAGELYLTDLRNGRILQLVVDE